MYVKTCKTGFEELILLKQKLGLHKEEERRNEENENDSFTILNIIIFIK